MTLVNRIEKLLSSIPPSSLMNEFNFATILKMDLAYSLCQFCSYRI